MAGRLVLADASPLIGLAAAGVFELLRHTFGSVTVTSAVRDEVLAGGDLPGAREVAAGIDAGRILVRSTARDADAFHELGEGEATTLSLAAAHEGPCLLLMDEVQGRAHARERGLTVTGLAGVLLAAKRAGLIDAVAPHLTALEASDFRLAPKIVQAVLEEAGESR